MIRVSALKSFSLLYLINIYALSLLLDIHIWIKNIFSLHKFRSTCTIYWYWVPPEKQSLCHKTIQSDIIFSSNVERSSSVCIALLTELVIAQSIKRFLKRPITLCNTIMFLTLVWCRSRGRSGTLGLWRR